MSPRRGFRVGRRALLGHAAATALVTVSASCGVTPQPTKRIPRLGYFAGTDPPDPALKPFIDAFLSGLRDHGYEDGASIVIEWRYSGNRDEPFDDMAAEFARLPVDVMVASNVVAIRAAARATSTIPIVMLLGSDPVETGLIQSLARPGTNVTGMAVLTAVSAAKRLELLKETVPGISRVAILAYVREGDPSGPLQLRAAEDAARALRVEAVPLEIRDPSELPRALDAATARTADALLLTAPPVQLIRLRKEIVSYATSRRIPSAYTVVGAFVEEGGLIGYSESGIESFRRAASFVDRIIKGAKPADLPVEHPTKFDLVINLKTAKELGLTITPSILARATKVIQ